MKIWQNFPVENSDFTKLKTFTSKKKNIFKIFEHVFMRILWISRVVFSTLRLHGKQQEQKKNLKFSHIIPNVLGK
jgi:hypothetical protein